MKMKLVLKIKNSEHTWDTVFVEHGEYIHITNPQNIGNYDENGLYTSISNLKEGTEFETEEGIEGSHFSIKKKDLKKLVKKLGFIKDN